MSWASPASWRNQGGGTPVPYPPCPRPHPATSSWSAPAPRASSPRSSPRGEGARVTLVSARPLAETASYWAQGGLAAALAAEDSPARHLEDTLVAGPRPRPPHRRRGPLRRGARALRRPRGARRPLRRRPPRRRSRSGWRAATPCAASCTPAAARPAAGSCASSPPTSSRQGASTCSRAAASARCSRRRRPHHGVALDDGRTLPARAVILASGGAAALWSRTTNPPGSFGSGLMLARAAGAELADLEFVQFHPTAVVGITGREGFLVTEAIRGEGATLHDARGRALRRRARSRATPSPRRSTRLLVETGAPAVYLDMTAIDPARFPNVVDGAARGRPGPGDGADPRLAREPLRHGRDHHRPRRPQHRPRPVRRRRVRLHRPARREPARLQLAQRVLRVRPPRRARRARRALPPRRRSARRPPATSRPRRAARRATAMWRDAGSGADGRGPAARCSKTRTRSPGSWPPRRSRARRAAARTRGPSSPLPTRAGPAPQRRSRRPRSGLPHVEWT